jgi:hypothetical protein
MSAEANLELKTLTIRIPMRLARRGGRKLVLTPDGAAPAPQRQLPDDTMVKALVRAHRWRRKIESGEAASITVLAQLEGVTAPYVFRLLRLTCLAPDIVAAILDGRQPKGAALADLTREVPLSWEDQGALWARECPEQNRLEGAPQLLAPLSPGHSSPDQAIRSRVADPCTGPKRHRSVDAARS